MKRFIQGEHRIQKTLFPETLDNYVTECNPVRVVEVFVEELDLGTLGFEGVKPEATGRPAYHPSTLFAGNARTIAIVWFDPTPRQNKVHPFWKACGGYRVTGIPTTTIHP